MPHPSRTIFTTAPVGPDIEGNIPLLRAPTMASGGMVMGATLDSVWMSTKLKQTNQLLRREPCIQWIAHQGKCCIPTDSAEEPALSKAYHGGMGPTRLACVHPTKDLLAEGSKYGCPINTGKIRHKTKCNPR